MFGASKCVEPSAESESSSTGTTICTVFGLNCLLTTSVLGYVGTNLRPAVADVSTQHSRTDHCRTTPRFVVDRPPAVQVTLAWLYRSSQIGHLEEVGRGPNLPVVMAHQHQRHLAECNGNEHPFRSPTIRRLPRHVQTSLKKRNQSFLPVHF